MTDPKLNEEAAAHRAAKKAALVQKRADAKVELRRLQRNASKELTRANGPSRNSKDIDERSITTEAQRRRAETSRLRIQTGKIIDKIQSHAMGKTAMTPTQLAAAQTLLRKTLPDLVGVKAELDVSPVIFNFAIDR